MLCFCSGQMRSMRLPKMLFTGWLSERLRWMARVSLSSLLLTWLAIDTDVGTGEHGVGLGKKEYLVEELGLGTVELMKTIKRAIDPLGLFNPGKVGYVFLLDVGEESN